MAKLYCHLLNEKLVGIEIPQYSYITEPFKIVEDTIPLGYADVSSISNWWNYGFNLNRDFIYVRTEIAKLIQQVGIKNTVSTITSPIYEEDSDYGKSYYIDPNKAEGDWKKYGSFIATWTLNGWIIEEPAFVGYRYLSSDEKLIAANLKIGSQLDHLKDFGVPSIVDYGIEYHRKSIAARAERLLIASVELYNILPLNVAEVLGSLTASPIGDVYTRYEKFGVKGTLEDYNTFFNPNPTPGIADYIMARYPWNDTLVDSGFPKGILLQDWNPIDGSSIQDFANHLYNILIRGNFDVKNKS